KTRGANTRRRRPSRRDGGACRHRDNGGAPENATRPRTVDRGRGEGGFPMARYGAATRFGSSSMSSTMQEVGAALARQAELTGERLQSLASAFREALPTNGAAALVSEGLGSASSYFGGREFGDVAKDVVDLVRRHPVQAMFLGA